MASMMKILPGMGLFFLVHPSIAATATSSFNVTASVSAACSVSASDLGFGTYNPTTAANLDATTTLSVTCTNGSGYDVGLNAGAGTGATVNVRKMSDGSSHTINYTLYQNSGRSTLWGNTVSNDTVSGTGSGAAQSLTVYGRIFSSNDATTIPPGSYSDLITVTVTF